MDFDEIASDQNSPTRSITPTASESSSLISWPEIIFEVFPNLAFNPEDQDFMDFMEEFTLEREIDQPLHDSHGKPLKFHVVPFSLKRDLVERFKSRFATLLGLKPPSLKRAPPLTLPSEAILRRQVSSASLGLVVPSSPKIHGKNPMPASPRMSHSSMHSADSEKRMLSIGSPRKSPLLGSLETPSRTYRLTHFLVYYIFFA
jgi:hypothetical protein